VDPLGLALSQVDISKVLRTYHTNSLLKLLHDWEL